MAAEAFILGHHTLRARLNAGLAFLMEDFSLFLRSSVCWENCRFTLPLFQGESVFKDNYCFTLPVLSGEAVYEENSLFILPFLPHEAV